MSEQTLEQLYQARLGGEPTFDVRAPGRVNLIGEHTDYNDGFVMPMAIDRGTRILLRSRDDRKVVLYSQEFAEEAVIDLDDLVRGEDHWSEYPKGVAWVLAQEEVPLQGWEGVMNCTVPQGAGLSSSASFELAIARAFSAVAGFDWDAPKMALTGQRAENEWVGVNCGIMDQMISACGEEGHALLLDCRSLQSRLVPVPDGAYVMVMDTSTRRGLVDSAYNERRSQCEEAAKILGVKALRDVSLAELEAAADRMPELTLRRARHVVSENERTEAAAEAMASGDEAGLGALMDQSHVSLRDDFEVSSEALDVMVEVAQATPGTLGARMTGAGFGGCAVALVKTDDVDGWVRQVHAGYQERTGHEPAIYACRASQGAHVV